MLRKILLAAATAAALGTLAVPAWGKATQESHYSYDQTFGSALRLLKVDLEMEVTEVNADWGYILFVYIDSESGKRKNRGSFSFIRAEEKVTVTLQLPELPSYHEQNLIEKLRRKLLDENGDPPIPQKKPPPKKDEKKDEADEGKDDKKPDEPKKDEPSEKAVSPSNRE
jgi:hypothetical protein